MSPSPNEPTSELLELVASLPEVYQPIYGHEDLESSRSAETPRIAALLETIELLSEQEGRHSRVLDLGSAQGYVGFRLAELGHHVTGIEYLEANVAVAEAVANEHPQLDAVFIHGDVADVSSLVELESYDVVLGLSVLHHIADRNGHDAARDLVARLAEHIPNGFFELALASEPLPWAAALPHEPRATIAPFAFIHELARSATHLSEIQRPLFFCSQRWVIVGGALKPIRRWSTKSHAQSIGVQKLAMRYFWLDGSLTKVAARVDDTVPDATLGKLRDDLRREARVLEALHRVDVDAPTLLDFFDGPHETILTRTMYAGDLVSDVLDSLTTDERQVVTTNVIDELALLESHGLFHSDVRLWNIVLDRDLRRAHLIDYGAVRSQPVDVVAPYDAYLSFVLFLSALWASTPDQTGERLPRSLAIDGAELPASVVELVTLFLTHDRNANVFSDLRADWERLLTSGPDSLWPRIPLSWDWLSAAHRHLESVTAALSDASATMTAQAGELEALHGHVATLHDRFSAEATELRREIAATQADRDLWRSAHDQSEASSQQLGRVHDELVLAHDEVLLAHDELVRAHDELLRASDELGRANFELTSHLEAVAANRQSVLNELQATRDSFSWRVTAPIRGLRRATRPRR